MRKEKTIRDKINKMRSSKYAEYHATEIASLEWVLGEAKSIRQRAQEVRKQYAKNNNGGYQ